jgi:hypothetical protein
LRALLAQIDFSTSQAEAVSLPFAALAGVLPLLAEELVLALAALERVLASAAADQIVTGETTQFAGHSSVASKAGAGAVGTDDTAPSRRKSRRGLHDRRTPPECSHRGSSERVGEVDSEALSEKARQAMNELYEAADDESTEDKRRAASEEAIPAPKNPDAEQLARRIAGSVAAVAGELEPDQARIEATLLGLAVADALGAPFEAFWADEAAAAVEGGAGE